MKDPGTKILIAVATLIPAAVLLYFMARNRPPGVDRDAEQKKNESIVLGRQLADARAKEEERLRGGGTKKKSPLPEGEFEPRAGEFGLLNPSPQPYDRALREFCSGFAIQTEGQREAIRGAISMGEFYILMGFADRSAVFALREGDPAILQDGLTALAMIDGERIDFRDVLMSIALLNHSAERLQVDVAATFESAAALAEPRTAELLRSFVRREPSSKSLEKSWGHREVELDSGIGFVSSGFAEYQPQHDLIGLGLGIAAALDADELYDAHSIEVASELPPIWLSGVDDAQVGKLLAAAGAGMSVRATPTDPDDRDGQMFVVFTIELDSPESAQALVDISKQARRSETAMLGVARENVFSLVVARSTISGTKSLEEGDSLERFAGPIGEALEQAEPIEQP